MPDIAKNNYLTLILLCLGYFIDFYDLTIMGVSYNELLHEQFHINELLKIQQTYLLISNCQTVGIFLGAILFGYLGDRLGRATAIKYSILLYSLATIGAVYTHSLAVFICLRLLAYVGLATEFATSTILILELFPLKSASWNSAILYVFGVLGGMCATFIGLFSWKLMFLGGGLAGLLVFLARNKINEPAIYLESKHKYKAAEFGNFKTIFATKHYLFSLFNYLLMILPFYAIITMMFLFPNYIATTLSLAAATKILLLGFFCGNIISCLISTLINNYYKNYKASMLIMLVLFLLLMLNFRQITQDYLFYYSIGLGFIGGGYPISWAQQVSKDYPTPIRSLASNILFAGGRASSIVFNSLMSMWLINAQLFIHNALISIIIIFGLALSSLYFSKNVYNKNITTGTVGVKSKQS